MSPRSPQTAAGADKDIVGGPGSHKGGTKQFKSATKPRTSLGIYRGAARYSGAGDGVRRDHGGRSDAAPPVPFSPGSRRVLDRAHPGVPRPRRPRGNPRNRILGTGRHG